jgi:hypothetical protein
MATVLPHGNVGVVPPLIADLADERHCRTASTPLRTSGATVITRPEQLTEWGLESQTLVELRYGGRSVLAWLQSTSDYPGADWTAPSRADCELWLSRRAREALGVQREEVPTVTLRLPARARLEYGSARIDDLPRGAEVDVARPVLQHLAGRDGYALLVAGGRCMPVRLRERPIEPQQIRLSMLARSLLRLRPRAAPEGAGDEVPGAPPERKVLLCALPIEGALWSEMLRRQGGRRGGRAVQAARWCVRSAMFGLERVLQPVLGAPCFAFRTTEALIGDDVLPVVRLPPASFPLIGIRPGDQVVLTWARRAAVAIALEQVPLSQETTEELRRQQMVDLRTGRRPRDEDHITVEVAASMRHVLGIPRETVVQVHRRLWPQVAVRLNALLLPTGGLLLAAAAIQGFKPLWTWLGMAAIVAAEVLHLRLPVPPRGRWH